MKKLNTFLFVAFLSLLIGCQVSDNPKKVLFINSYHQGYASSDSILAGINSVFDTTGIVFETVYMDTKRKSDSISIKEAVYQVLKKYKELKPDAVIASDDNAVKYVVEPHLKGEKIPVIFCGVNWSADQYGLPAENVTGMLEVLPLKEVLFMMKQFRPGATSLVVLSENSLSEQNNKVLLDTLYRSVGFQNISYFLVENFEAWQTAFLEANNYGDVIYMPTNGAIKGWDNKIAEEHVLNNFEKPIVTCDDFMMPFAMFGLTKIASEQGEWAASTVLDIFNGKKPEDIPLARNQKWKAYQTKQLAQQIGFEPRKYMTKFLMETENE